MLIIYLFYDMFFITVEVLDKDGNLCSRVNSLLFFDVEVDGYIKAVCNENSTERASFASSYMREFKGNWLWL